MNAEPGADEVYVIDMQRVARLVFLSCLALILLFIVCDYVFNYLDVTGERGIRRIWNIAREQSLPTWFSSVQAQLLGVTVCLIAWAESRSVSVLKTAAWLLTGLFFLWVGIDDYAEIHEKLGGALERLAGKGDNTAVTEMLLRNPSFSWHTFIAPVFALCGLGILAFLWRSFWRLGLIHFLVLGFGCWAVAQGIDFIEGLDRVADLHLWLEEAFGADSRYGVTHSLKVIEEVLEMLGTTLLWTGFLKYLAVAADGLNLRLDSRHPN
jgi:hypothetical protein